MLLVINVLLGRLRGVGEVVYWWFRRGGWLWKEELILLRVNMLVKKWCLSLEVSEGLWVEEYLVRVWRLRKVVIVIVVLWES